MIRVYNTGSFDWIDIHYHCNVCDTVIEAIRIPEENVDLMEIRKEKHVCGDCIRISEKVREITRYNKSLKMKN